MITFELNGVAVSHAGADTSLLDVLRTFEGVISPKDGCSPQGQCGCCTVLIDGSPRVACVTPASRVAGRTVTTAEGLESDVAASWADAFLSTGGSQCGFCTPGIVMRLEALRRGDRLGQAPQVIKALAAHVCRCTGYQTILEAGDAFGSPPTERDLEAAARRAELEGGDPQQVGADVVLGGFAFADDVAVDDAVIAYPAGDGGWALGETVVELRRAVNKVQGRNTTVPPAPPMVIPHVADAVVRLATCFVEPAYLDPDTAIAGPDVPTVGPAGNGGSFGAKTDSPLAEVAERACAQLGRSVKAVWPREEIVRSGHKRPPLALALDASGRGVIVVPDVDGAADAAREVFPLAEVRTTDVLGPRCSMALRGAVRAELSAVRCVLERPEGPFRVDTDAGGYASASYDESGLHVEVDAGEPLEPITLRSYCIGAAHMAMSQVRTEAIALGADGVPLDLTFRSFGILRPADMPQITVRIIESERPSEPISVAVMAAVMAATWAQSGFAPAWPTERAVAMMETPPTDGTAADL